MPGLLKVAPAVLIGVASLLGALVGWHAAQVSGRAGGADGAAVAQQQLAARDLSQATIVANTEATAHARHALALTAAEDLDQLAGRAEDEGRVADAVALSGEAQLLAESAREITDRYYDFEAAGLVDPETGRFETTRRRQELVLQYPRDRHEVAPSPERAAAAAEDDRDRTLQLGAIVLVLAAALFVLTVAELSAGRRAILATGVGALLVLGSAAAAGVAW